jgi:3-oxoacyl-[acyl-carrier-protein] synthase II
MEIAITGMGTISPLGTTVADLYNGLLAGQIGIRDAPWSSVGDAGLYAAVDDRFDPSEWLDDRVVAGTDGFARFALAACAEAVRDAGLDGDSLDPFTTGVVHGTSMGGHFSVARAQRDFEHGGAEAIDRKTQIKIWPNMAAAQICLAYELHGPSITVTTACASSLDALNTAALYLNSGMAEVVLVGATEGGYTADPGSVHFQPGFVASEQAYGMSSGQIDPKRAMLPFDANRVGIVSGEGSAFFVLETPRHAADRGARVRAWLRGTASLADAYHPSSPEPDGRWEQLVMERAQQAAKVSPRDIDAVIAHATGTPKGDQAEIRALNRVFDSHEQVVVTGLKGHTGHTGASSGAMSIIAGIRAMETGNLAAIAGTDIVDPEANFDVAIDQPRQMDVGLLQVNSFGFGGQNASVIVGQEAANAGS